MLNSLQRCFSIASAINPVPACILFFFLASFSFTCQFNSSFSNKISTVNWKNTPTNINIYKTQRLDY
ncbi:hypothetical protein CsatB_017443 [Cannabis sativa]